MANDFCPSTLLSMDHVQVVALCEVDRARCEHAHNRVDMQYATKSDAQGCVATEIVANCWASARNETGNRSFLMVPLSANGSIQNDPRT